MKTNKHHTLLLVRQQKTIHLRDLAKQVGYTPGTARSYLSYLKRQGLLERMGASYVLTEKGENRVQHFEVSGCSDPACPLCQGKAGYLTCPHCGHRMAKREAGIRKERDFLLAIRHPGVYCDSCWRLILNPGQARLLGIREEE